MSLKDKIEFLRKRYEENGKKKFTPLEEEKYADLLIEKRETGSGAKKKESLWVYCNAIYNSDEIYTKISKLLNTKIPSGTKGNQRMVPRITTIAFFKKLMGLSEIQKTAVLDKLILNPNFSQADAIKIAVVYQQSNNVKDRYIKEFSLLDDMKEKYSWSKLTNKYPAICNTGNFEHWTAVFAKSKKKPAPELLSSFRNHCMTVRSEVSMRISMSESTQSMKKENSQIQVITGDAMLLDKALTREKFSLIIIDPPYGILSNVEWDKAPWKTENFKKCFTEIIKINELPNYCISVFSSIQQVSYISEAFNQVGITDFYSVVWYKKNAHGQISGTDFLKLISAYEIITFGYYGNRSNCTMNYFSTPNIARFNVWECNVPSRSEIQCDNVFSPINPAQKPLALLRMLITRHSNPSDNILDLCSGTGTAALAAVTLSRNVVCVEKDPFQASKILFRIDTFNYDSLSDEPADPFTPRSEKIDDSVKEECILSQTMEDNICALCQCEINIDNATTCTECFLKYCSDCMNSKGEIACSCTNTIYAS